MTFLITLRNSCSFSLFHNFCHINPIANVPIFILSHLTNLNNFFTFFKVKDELKHFTQLRSYLDTRHTLDEPMITEVVFILLCTLYGLQVPVRFCRHTDNP